MANDYPPWNIFFTFITPYFVWWPNRFPEIYYILVTFWLPVRVRFPNFQRNLTRISVSLWPLCSVIRHNNFMKMVPKDSSFFLKWNTFIVCGFRRCHRKEKSKWFGGAPYIGLQRHPEKPWISAPRALKIVKKLPINSQNGSSGWKSEIQPNLDQYDIFEPSFSQNSWGAMNLRIFLEFSEISEGIFKKNTKTCLDKAAK